MPKLYKKVHDKKNLAIAEETKSCELCGYEIADLEVFNEHVRAKHTGDIETQPIFKCSRCDLEVLNESELKKHSKKSHKKCDHCPFPTTKLTILKPHMDKEHGGSVRCEVCNFSAIDVKSLKKHIEEDHVCSKCKKSKGKKASLDCKTCKMPTHVECLKTDIGKDKTEKYRTNPNEFQCKSCLEDLIGIGNNSSVFINQEYACNACLYKSNNEKDLREHETTHENNSEICDICQEVLKTPRDLEKHMSIHVGTSNFNCPICPYKAKTAEEVQLHMQDHDNNVVKGLEQSCRKLEEQIVVERKCNEKNVAIIKELESKVKALSSELEQSKIMVSNEIRKN